MIDLFRDLFLSLLPEGRIWNKLSDSFLFKLCEGMGVEFSRIKERGEDLRVEIQPALTQELLEDWERVFGLPDSCDPEAQSLTVNQRRQRLLSKIVNTLGGQNPAFYIQYAAALGFVVTVTQFDPFVAGSVAGDALTNDDWTHYWQLNLPSEVYYRFTAGSRAGEALLTVGNDYLECAFAQLAPAHTSVLFAFEEV